MVRKLNILNSLRLLLQCNSSLALLEETSNAYRENTIDYVKAAENVVNTYQMFEELMAYKEGESNPLADYYREAYYKDRSQKDVLNSLMVNPNVIYILSNTPYDREQNYDQNLFVATVRGVMKNISSLKDNILLNLHLAVSYKEESFYSVEDSKISKIKYSESYPDNNRYNDKNIEILSDLFKAKLNSLNKNNILESLRMLAGGNTIQEVSEIFNCSSDIRPVLIDLIEKMVGAMADFRLIHQVFQVRASKIMLDSANDLLTNVQKEAAGILINIENQVFDNLVMDNDELDTFDNAVILTNASYSVVIHTAGAEIDGSKRPYSYSLAINNFIQDGNLIISKENAESLTEESLLVIMGEVIIDLYNLIESAMVQQTDYIAIRDMNNKTRDILSKAENKIYKDFKDIEDLTSLEAILDVNYTNRELLSRRMNSIMIYKNTISNEDVAVIARVINLFIESLNN